MIDKAKLEAAKRNSTAQLLFRCARLLNERALSELPRRFGISPRAAHTTLLPHIDWDVGTRLTDLAARVGITKQAVGQLVDELEAVGVVERVPDPDDGRAKRVVFTPQGKRDVFEGLEHLARLEKDLTAEVGQGVMDSLRVALLVLHDHLSHESERGALSGDPSR